MGSPSPFLPEPLPNLPGALGDHVEPSLTSSVFRFFLHFFSWKWMVHSIRVLNALCGWMDGRKGIELLGWEVVTAPFKLGF